MNTVKRWVVQTGLTALVFGVGALGLIAGNSVVRHARVFEFWAEAANPPKDAAPADQADRYQNLELFQKVLHFVENNYVEKVKNKDLVQGAIKGMLSTLDPHSNFLPPEIFKDMKVDTSGKFGGLGIEIGVRDGVLTIMAPMEDTPAWHAGVKAGDRILKIDGTATKGMTVTEAASKMRGKKGQKVVLTIFRKGFDKARDVSIVRDIIKVNPVRSEILEPSYGYVRLRTFNENAASDLKKALEGFEKKGAIRGLVFDMRGNPGGLLDQAVEVTSLFIDEGVVVSTIGRNKEQIEERIARKGVARKGFPVAILVDSSTASAAEIVAGALQDHQRAVVMGQPTFGKGSVQTVIELGQEMGLKLTIARYFTPKGRSIQEKGVAPDILLESYDPKLLAKARVKGDALREKDLPGHIVNEDQDNSAEVILQDGEALEITTKKREEAEDEMTPVRVEPKQDTQVREALNYLKSFEIFQKMKDKPSGAAAGA